MEYNHNLFNVGTFNGLYGVVPVVADLSEVSFAGYALDAGDLMVTEIDHDGMPARDRDTFSLPRTDGGGSLGDYWRGKKVTINGYIQATTRDALEAKIDEFKQYMATENGDLRLVVAGAVRVYKGTVKNYDSMLQRRFYHQTFIPFRLEFDCSVPDGYGRAESYTANEFNDKTDLIFTEEVIHVGSAKARPVVRVNISAATTLTSIKFKNNTTGQEITALATYAPGDLLEFDSENMTVKINGTEVDFTGQFPLLAPGTNNFTLTLTATSATFSLTINHKSTFF